MPAPSVLFGGKEGQNPSEVSEFAVNMRPGIGMCLGKWQRTMLDTGGSTGWNILGCKEAIGIGCQDWMSRVRAHGKFYSVWLKGAMCGSDSGVV
jgi:hypothetical protein